MTLFIIAVLMAVAAIAASYRPYVPAYLPAYAALWLLKWSGAVNPGTWILTSWGTATAVVLIADMAQPRMVSKATNGLAHMATGALAGTMAGLCTATYVWTAVGAALGTAIGVAAYIRTPSGAALGFASPRFSRYIPAKFFPIVVTYCMLGIFALLIIMAYAPAYALNQM